MTASEKVWQDRDPDGRGIWWSDEENQFVCEATLLSALPIELLEKYPTNDSTYWNMFYVNVHLALSKYRQKAYCKDIIFKLGKNPKITMNTLKGLPRIIHPSFPEVVDDIIPEQYIFSPSSVGFCLGIDVYHQHEATRHIVESTIANKEDGSWTHYSPFELQLINPDTVKVTRLKLMRRILHQMLILGNHAEGFGSCFCSHEQILAHVSSGLYDDLISKGIAIEDPHFVP